MLLYTSRLVTFYNSVDLSLLAIPYPLIDHGCCGCTMHCLSHRTHGGSVHSSLRRMTIWLATIHHYVLFGNVTTVIYNTLAENSGLGEVWCLLGAPIKTIPLERFYFLVTVTDVSPNLWLSQRRTLATYTANFVTIFAMVKKLQSFEIKMTFF